MFRKQTLLWAVVLAISFFVTSCTSDSSDDLIGVPDDTSKNGHLEFEAKLNGTIFKADQIAFVKEETVIHFVATNSGTGESIFLTLDAASGNALELGTTVDNPKNNVAGLLVNSDGYMTSNVNAPTGEVNFSLNSLKDELFEGTFFFTASDENDNYIYVTGGKFSKK